MIKFFETVTNARGDSLPNYRVQVVDSAGAAVAIYADSSETVFTDSAGNTVNYALASTAGKAEFYWTPATGQVLQVLDVSGNLVDATADFADKYVLSSLPGEIAQSAVTDLVDDLTGKVAVADLASTDSAKGAALVGVKRSKTGAVDRDVRDVLDERGLRVTDFGADPTGVADSLAAIEACRTACLLDGKAMVFPQGSYLISDTLELGYTRLHVVGEGRVVIQADFDGGAVVSADAGDAAIIYQSSIRNLIVRGNGSASQTGFYFRNAVHAVREDLRVRNVTYAAFHVIGDVLSTYRDCWSSLNHEGVGGEAVPQYDMIVDGSTAISATAACLFENFVSENATATGLWGVKMASCRFIGGTAENLPGKGVVLSSDCLRNSFEQFYCEENGTVDFEVSGNFNVFTNCEAYDLARTTLQWEIKAGAKGNRIEKCGVASGSDRYTRIEIEATAEDTVIRDCVLYELDDAGTRTWLENWSDTVNKVESGRSEYDGGAGGFLPAFGGSSADGTFTYDVRDGCATRHGRTVFFDVSLRVLSVTSGATGDAQVIGFPWAAERGFGTVIEDDAITYPGSATVLAGHFSGTEATLRGNKGGGSLPGSALTGGSLLRITGHYEVA